MSEKDQKPRKIRHRRTTGRVSGTTQSDFASSSMSTILQKQQSQQAKQSASEHSKPEKGEGGNGDPADPAANPK